MPEDLKIDIREYKPEEEIKRTLVAGAERMMNPEEPDDFDYGDIKPEQNQISDDGFDYGNIKPEHSFRRDFGRFVNDIKGSARNILKSQRLKYIYATESDLYLRDPETLTTSEKMQRDAQIFERENRRLRAIEELTALTPGDEILEETIQIRMAEIAHEDKVAAYDWLRKLEEMEFLEADPRYTTSSGFIEDVSGATGSSILGLITAAHPFLSYETIFHQTRGAITEEAVIAGAPEERAFKAGTWGATASAPLEMLGNALQLRAMFPSSGKWMSRLLLAGEALGGNFIEEYAQKAPEEFSLIWALNPDLEETELTGLMWDRFTSGDYQTGALYEGVLGMTSAGVTMTAGKSLQKMGQGFDYLISDKQKRINNERIRKFTEIVSKENPTQEDINELVETVGMSPEYAEKISEGLSTKETVEQIKSRVLFQSDTIKSKSRQKIKEAVLSHKRFSNEEAEAYMSIWDGIAYSLFESGDIKDPGEFFDMFEFRAGELSTKETAIQKELNQFAKPIDFKITDATIQIKENTAFQKWFGESKVVDENGKPLIVYHGTNARFTTFQPNERGAYYFHEYEDLADQYGKNRMPVYLKAENIFDYENPKHQKILMETIKKSDGFEDWMISETEDGDWEMLEKPSVIKMMKDNGFDSYYVNDHPGKAIAVFEPTQIKSIYNRGTFDITNPNILAQQRLNEFSQVADLNLPEAVKAVLKNKNFQEMFKDTEVLDENGVPKVVYSGHANIAMYGDFYSPQKSTAGGFYATDDPEIAGSYAMGKLGVKEYYENGAQYRLEGKNKKLNKKIWQYELTDDHKSKINELRETDKKLSSDGEPFHLNEMDRYIENMKDYDAMVRRWAVTGGSNNLQNVWEFYESMGYNIAYDKIDETGQMTMVERQTQNLFEDLLEELGIKWNSYDRAQPGVMPVFLNIKNPLDASKPFPKELLAALKKKAKYERKKTPDANWTKEYSLKDFVDDIESGNEYWSTQIPTKALAIIKEFGYDGIKEMGKKGGPKESSRQVNWIAFSPEQIKSVFNKGGFDPKNKRMLYQTRYQDYVGDHTAPINDGYSAPGHNLGDMYPDDIYGPNAARYYGHGEMSMDLESINIIREMRNNPNKRVAIYRAVPIGITKSERITDIENQLKYIHKTGKIPRGVDTNLSKSEYYEQIYDELESLKKQDITYEKTKINPGDWVTINKQYAREHGKNYIGRYKIVQKTVKAKDIFTDGNSIHEWGYDPSGKVLYQTRQTFSESVKSFKNILNKHSKKKSLHKNDIKQSTVKKEDLSDIESQADRDFIESLISDPLLQDHGGYTHQVVDNVIEYAIKNNIPFTIIMGDGTNINGLNKYYEHQGIQNFMRRADEDIIKVWGEAFVKPLADLGIIMGRQSDEFHGVALGYSVEEVEEIMTGVKAQTEALSRELGLADIGHLKHDGLPTGALPVYYGIIDGGKNYQKLQEEADNAAERMKQRFLKELAGKHGFELSKNGTYRKRGREEEGIPPDLVTPAAGENQYIQKESRQQVNPDDRNSKLSAKQNRKAEISRILAQIKNDTVRTNIENQIKDTALEDYGVTSKQDINRVAKELDKNNIDFIIEFTTIGNGGAANAKFGSHAVMDRAMREIIGEEYVKQIQKYGGIVSRKGMDFITILPNYTVEEAKIIRSEIEDKLAAKRDKLYPDLKNIGHPKKGDLPVGSMNTYFGFSEKQQYEGKFDFRNTAEIARTNANKMEFDKDIDTAKKNSYDWIESASTWNKGKTDGKKYFEFGATGNQQPGTRQGTAAEPSVRPSAERNIPGPAESPGGSRQQRSGRNVSGIPTTDQEFYQSDDLEKLGAIENLFTNEPAILHAFAGADVSTPIHETGHFLTKILHQYRPEDYKIIAEWCGVDPDRAGGGLTAWTDEELEKVARGFERYVMEGKAPTMRLHAVFKKMKQWLFQIYKSVKNLNVEISPEVSGVFDRLISTQEQRMNDPVYDVLDWYNVDDPAFSSPSESDMAEYENLAAKARQIAVDRIKEKRAKEEKAMDREFKRAAKSMVDELEIYDVMQSIVNAGGMNYESIRGMFGQAMIEDLNTRRKGLISKKGSDPDQVAIDNGYETVDDLIEEVMASKPKKEEYERIYNEMWGEYSSAVQDIDFVTYEEYLDEEIKILNKLLGKKPKARKELKGIIREQTGQVKPEEYRDLRDNLKRMEKLAREAYRAAMKDTKADLTEKHKEEKAALKDKFKKQQLERVLKLKEKQKATIERLRENQKNQQERARIGQKMKRYLQLKTASLPIEYKEQIIDIIGRYYALSPFQQKIKPRQNIESLLEKAELQGENVDVPRMILKYKLPDPRQKGKSMDLNDLRIVEQFVDCIVHLGRTTGKLIAGKHRIDLDTAVDQLVTQIFSAHTPKPLESPFETIRQDRAKIKAVERLKSFFLEELDQPEFIMRALDGWEDLGPVWEALIKPVKDAWGKELLLGSELTDKLKIAFENAGADRKWANETYDISYGPEGRETTEKLSKEQLFMIALNSFNDGNRNALKAGYGFTDEQLDNIWNKLTKTEKKLCSDVWEIFDSLFPMLEDVHLKHTGARLIKVEGKYFPLVFERAISTKAEKFGQEKELKDLFAAEYHMTRPDWGHRHERVGGRMPPLLSLSVLQAHVQKTIHDITHQLAVRDVQKIIAHPRFMDAVKRTLGERTYKQLMPWLQHVARPTYENNNTSTEWFWKHLRKTSTIAAMGFKLTTAADQWLAIFNAAPDVGTLRVLQGLKQFYRNPKQAVQWVNELSPQMRFRANQFDRDLNQFAKSFDPKSIGWTEDIKEAAFYLIKLNDLAVTYPVWIGAYHKGLKKFKVNQDKAIDYADMIVRKTQSSADPWVLSAFQRGGKTKSEAVKMVGMFYSFFAAFKNQMRETHRRYGAKDINTVELLGAYWWKVILPGSLGGALIPKLIAYSLLGDDENDEDLKELLKKIPKNLVGYYFGGIPVLRDVVNGFMYNYGYSFTPIEEAFESMVSLGRGMASGADYLTSKKMAKGLIKTAGYVFGIPSSQINVTLDGILNLIEGEGDISELFFYKPKKEKKKRRYK